MSLPGATVDKGVSLPGPSRPRPDCCYGCLGHADTLVLAYCQGRDSVNPDNGPGLAWLCPSCLQARVGV